MTGEPASNPHATSTSSSEQASTAAPAVPLPGRIGLPLPPTQPDRFAAAPAGAPGVPWVSWVAVVLAGAASVFAWQQRADNHSLERELVRRQQESQEAVTEAKALARAAAEASRDAQSRAAVIETQVADSTVQRSQIESLMLTLNRTRDEQVVDEIESQLRSAVQQATWTGRSEPLIAAMKEADQRLASMGSTRLAAVRRALARDLQRVTAAAAFDGALLAQRIDEVLRQVEALPLTQHAPAANDKPAPAAGATHPHPSEALPLTWRDHAARLWQRWTRDVSEEARSLVRIARIEQPGAMLLEPTQAYFVRRNLELRLLTARMALLSRQTDVAQSDLKEARRILEAWFDRQSQRVVGARQTLEQVAAAAASAALPRPDETLTALAAVSSR
jgi:uroporphyrin-III C-methyltransferase